MNRKVVFGSGGRYGKNLFRYYALAVPQMLVSALLVSLLDRFIAPGSKIIATLLKSSGSGFLKIIGKPAGLAEAGQRGCLAAGLKNFLTAK